MEIDSSHDGNKSDFMQAVLRVAQDLRAIAEAGVHVEDRPDVVLPVYKVVPWETHEPR